MADNVWQDHVLVWHAVVPLTDSPSDDAAAARTLIRNAIRETYGRDALRRGEVRVTRAWVTNHGTVVYKRV